MDGSYQLLAARYLRKQTRLLIGRLDGARKADDVEDVHQARVASRRLRAGLGVFPDCFPGKKVKRWRKKVRRLTESLGPARDQDVQIEFVRGVLSELNDKTRRPGIARLLVRLEQNRRAVQPKVIKAVDRFEASGVASEMLAAAEKMRSKLKKRHLSVQSPFVFAQAQEHVSARLHELMQYEDCLGDPQDREQHHAMRIAAKRLRYTIEICQPAYEGRLEGFLKAVKGLQTLLGDIHDCDVWVDHLEAFLEEERERTVAYYGSARPFGALKAGLAYLQQERRDHREEMFGQLVQYWEDLDDDGLWEELARTIQPPTEPPGRPAPPPEGQPCEVGEEPGADRRAEDERPARGDLRGEDVRDEDLRGEDLKAEASRTAGPSAEPAGSDGRKAGRQGTLLGAGKPSGNGH